MTRHGVLLALMVLVNQSLSVGAQTSANAPPTTVVPVAGQYPLLVLEQNRASVVQRIVGDWAVELPGLPAGQRMTAEQLHERLWSLRSDRLLAASLAGSFATIEALFAAADAERGAVHRVATKSLGDASDDLTYTPINPCRIADTRIAGGPLAANVARPFDAFSGNFATQGGAANNCGMPNGVAAIAMDVYAVNPANLGFIKLWPANGSEPAVSTINYQPGIVAIATGAIVQVDASANNAFLAKSPSTVDFVADIVGYFKSPSGSYYAQGGNAFGSTAVAGTNDNFPLDLRVGNARAMRYEPNGTSPNLIGGHASNAAMAGFFGQTIAGGGEAGTDCYEASTNLYTRPCSNRTQERFAFVGGGHYNLAAGYESIVVGGAANTASGAHASVGGGFANTASGVYATVGAGTDNVASGQSSTISGGAFNAASGNHSTVDGGAYNTASGNFSLAAGYNAKAREQGMFAWADSRNFDFDMASVRPAGQSADTFNVRASGAGGVLFATGIDALTGAVTWACYAQNGTGWSCTSDRNQKRNLLPVDTKTVLARVAQLPIFHWQPKDGPHADARHVGPMAQDFYAAFGLGDSDTSIGMQDADGVALAAIQGLNALVQEKEGRIVELEHAVAELRRAIDGLAHSQ